MRQRHARGSALIVGVLAVSVFLVYSNALTMRTVGQHLAMDRMRGGQHALTLAQSALDQLREDFTDFVNETVNMDTNRGNALETVAWLDTLGAALAGGPVENPALDFTADGTGVRNATSANPWLLYPNNKLLGQKKKVLPTIDRTKPQLQPRAWLTGVQQCDPDATDPLAPRCVTIRAEASSGAVHKAVEGIYSFVPATANVFRYAYFINNFGWMENTNGYSWTTGEVRSNGNLNFVGNHYVMGDLYASSNSELGSGPGQPGEGTITGDPTEYNGWGGYPAWSSYWWNKGGSTRPATRLVYPGQVPIGGPANEQFMPYGCGWDSESPDPMDPEQRRFDHQPPQTMPYLGDLAFYKSLAKSANGTLTYYTDHDANNDGINGDIDWSSKTTFTGGVYKGQDGVEGLNPLTGQNDDYEPLVLYGDLTIDGPVVVPGDVIITGMVRGRGSIYAGRNIHITGNISYANYPGYYRSVQRNGTTGQLRALNGCAGGGANLGWVCHQGDHYNAAGQYVDPTTGVVDPGRTLPADCVVAP